MFLAETELNFRDFLHQTVLYCHLTNTFEIFSHNYAQFPLFLILKNLNWIGDYCIEYREWISIGKCFWGMLNSIIYNC